MIRYILFIIFLTNFLSNTMLFADSVINYAGGVVDNVSTGTIIWTTPGLAVGPPNATYAQASINDNEISHYLYATNYGFNIPANATITGIIVSPTRNSTSSTVVHDRSLRLITNGVINLTDRATSTAYTTSDVTEDHGSAVDNWGITLTPTIVNSPSFGTAFSVIKDGTALSARTISVDAIKITVYYTSRRRVVGAFIE